MEKDDLLNIKDNKRSIKKPLIYGAIAFLVFIIGVIGYAIYANSANKENVVLPPQVNEISKKESPDFKEVPIEVNTDKLNEKLNMQNLIDEEDKEEKKETKKEITPKSVKKTEKNELEQKSKISNVKSNKKKVVKKVVKKYYIQVAALTKYKRPNKKFLNLIKKEGFNYILYSTVIVKDNKKIPITKILIGPFENKKIAREKLKEVKEKITQNAFIFKVK
jgi:DedD protein